MDYPVQGAPLQRVRTRYLNFTNENELPPSYDIYKKEIIKRFNLIYELNFIFTNKDNKQEYITNDYEYQHFIAINKTIPIILAECDCLYFTKLPNASLERETPQFLTMGSMATLPMEENDEPLKEEDEEFQEGQEIIDLNKIEPEKKLVKMPPIRMGSGKPPRPHKTVHN